MVIDISSVALPYIVTGRYVTNANTNDIHGNKHAAAEQIQVLACNPSSHVYRWGRAPPI